MKVLAITQARYGSTRLPAKILKEVGGRTILEIHLRRALRARSIDKLKIATTDEEGARFIVAVAEKVGVEYFKGPVDDVLTRFYRTAAPEKPDYVVRLSSDCPLIDPAVIDRIVNYAVSHDFDYVSTDSASYPDGLDTEAIKFSALEKAYHEAELASEREHVTPYIRKNATEEGGTTFKSKYLHNPRGRFSAEEYRITIDEPEDFEVLSSLISTLGTDRPWKDYINYLCEHDELRKINSRFKYNEGYAKSLRNDRKIKLLWEKAKSFTKKPKR